MRHISCIRCYRWCNRCITHNITRYNHRHTFAAIRWLIRCVSALYTHCSPPSATKRIFQECQNFTCFVLTASAIFRPSRWGATRLVLFSGARKPPAMQLLLFSSSIDGGRFDTHWRYWASYTRICPRGAPKVLSCDQLCDTFGVPRAG